VAIIIRTIMAIWQDRALPAASSTSAEHGRLLIFNNGTLTINVRFLGIHDAVISAQRES
jgi:hypothetical protein